MVYILNSIGWADQECTGYVVFFHLLTVEYTGNMKIIRRKIMQRAEKSYSIDIVVISCHINTPNVGSFYRNGHFWYGKMS